MKKIRSIIIACVALAVCGVPAGFAQNAAKKPTRIEVLTEKLGLDGKQRAAIGKLYKAESDAVKAIRADDSLSKQEQNAKVAKLRAQLKKDIRAELKPEQAKQFDAEK